MSLKAIDMQVLVPRSHDVGKIQQLQLQHQQNQSHHTGVELRRDINVREISVNKSEYSETKIMDNNKESNEDGSKRRNNSSKPREQEEKEEKEEISPKHLGNILDIHI
ncbi:MAG: hypothetical protein VR72_01210 [Clostridiaceae bacterium BRH_c20a]|nr:MAG: hypothetical protein VR72_01210 [Clostridiaceae bacterium BRH_c20a]